MQSLETKYLETYAFCDPAAGKDARNKKRRARQCIVVGMRDWLERWFFPYIWAGHLTASDFKDKILDTQETWEPRRFGIEANGMQVLFGSLVREEAKLRFGRIKIIPIYQPTNVEKNFRIRTGIEPVILQGRFFLQEGELEARAELQGFPTAQTKDIVDAMETCMSRVAPKRPRKRVEDTETEDYARYLRNSGMPGHLIKQELARFTTERIYH